MSIDYVSIYVSLVKKGLAISKVPEKYRKKVEDVLGGESDG